VFAHHRSVALVLAIALMAVAPAATPKASPKPKPTPRPIAIVINGELLPLEPPPLYQRGRLFVPVRRTIEALGLDFNLRNKMITTHVGYKTVTLTVGSSVAMVDGTQLQLDDPTVEVNFVLYVPLRFFTDVLGAEASYDRRTNAVTIVSQIVGRSGSGVIRQPGGRTERFGTVSAIDIDSDPPTLTLQYNASVHTIPIGANASIDMHDVDADVTVPGELGDVRPGDFARIFQDKQGRVTRVVDAFGSLSGHIAAATATQFVTNDGHVITPDRDTQVLLNGKAAQVSDLKVGDSVTVRYNVETDEIRSILASRQVSTTSTASGGPQITNVVVDATRPLRAGDSFNVTLHGTPEASATFDIGSYVTGIPMSQSSPGVYTGSYTLPRGVNFSDVPIIGELQQGTQSAQPVAASATISAASTPPGVIDFAPAEGAIVQTNRPAIYATFASDAVPVNPSSVNLRVDGRDVTSECVRNERFIQYFPGYSYPSGPVRVEVSVSDEAGNVTTKAWTFTIR
jgi:hypothetical protein